MKKFRRSPIAICCYVIAALLLVYVIYTFVGTVTYLNGYFAAYGMTIAGNFKDALSYILTSCIQPFSFAVLVFMAGYILETVRKQDDANFCTAEELEERKAAKRAAKEAAKAAKTEEVKADEVVEEVVEEVAEATEEVEQ